MLPRLKWYMTITIQCSVREARQTERLVLNKARHADDGYKRMDLERHRLLIGPVSK